MGRERRDDGDLPVIDADAPIGRPRAGPVGRGRMGRAAPTRSVGVAVAALVLLTAGVAVGGLLEPTPSPSPPRVTTIEPEPTTVADCPPAGTTRLPAFDLVSIETGDRAPELPGYGNRGGIVRAGGGWKIPGGPNGERALRVDSDDILELRSARGECFTSIAAEFAPPGRQANDRQEIPLGAVVPPEPSVSIGHLPDGDWVVRVRAHFETGLTGLEGTLISEHFFRVRVGSGSLAEESPTPAPEPTPRVTPEAACGPTPAGDEAVTVVLTSADVGPVAGATAGEEPPSVTVRAGEELHLATLDAACAVAWEIRLRDPRFAAIDVVVRERNVTRDPRVAAQNSWRTETLPGDRSVVIELVFADGLTVTRSWLVSGGAFEVPDVGLVAADGARITGRPGCGLYLELSNGYTSGEDCTVSSVPTPLETLTVPAWSIVTIEVTGWTIVSWQGECGRLVSLDGGEYFESSCGLGGYDASGGSPPGPPRFLARPGEQLVLINVGATRDGDRFMVPVYAMITGT